MPLYLLRFVGEVQAVLRPVRFGTRVHNADLKALRQMQETEAEHFPRVMVLNTGRGIVLLPVRQFAVPRGLWWS